ncbi:DUF1330 domain-containing protein [Jannaschia sp. CCS1]|uniref:DUF1330 domain-containing protein n=1 Tax=Jannaschia sp. (strain CCS1) TaxID=290400 RepID=UPI000053C81A|nr:DUF1330 domain-containing protein [Jannaschia sp. CCS1]ABD55538.1 hypothetical protein Jann_2621 [Jannaschia sp. CCS1]
MSDTNPVYMIVMLEIDDMPTFFEDYANPLQAIHARHGVEVLAATPAPTVLEGDYTKSFTVLLKFASAEVHAEWWADPDYQPLRKRRHELTNTDTSLAMVVPTFTP